jgi:F-box and leucine-rich repeat protein 7
MRRHRSTSASHGKGSSPLSETVTLIRTFDSDTNPARPVRPSPLTRSGIQDMPLDMLDRIRSFPLFKSAPETFLAAIGAHLRPQLHAAHDYIITEGDDAKAMYWLVRGAVAVTSRDGESTYAELRPGAFFGEIGVLMGIPRTATIVARSKCLLVVLKKEDLMSELPNFPKVERVIRDEAQERLSILERKKKESGAVPTDDQVSPGSGRGEKRAFPGDAHGDLTMRDGQTNKKRKSPSPGIVEAAATSALGSGMVHIRQLLRELPLFASLPSEMLHFLGSNAHHVTYPPFTDIIRQDSMGREVYFIIKGEVEVIDESHVRRGDGQTNAAGRTIQPGAQVKARLRQGNYFGEVASLALAPRRTATVRSVSSVECLLITGEILAAFWLRCPPAIREQVEATAKARLHSTSENDVIMSDLAEAGAEAEEMADGKTGGRRASVPKVTVDYGKPELTHPSPGREGKTSEPLDPDPFLNTDLNNVRSRSRRSSLAPPSPESPPPEKLERLTPPASARSRHGTTPPPPLEKTEKPAAPKRPDTLLRRQSSYSKGPFPDNVLVRIFLRLELHELMSMRRVSMHWSKLLRESPRLFRQMNLSRYNRKVTDEAVITSIGPFVGDRPRFIDISNCFHLTDEGFTALASFCGANVMSWRMKSVWDVSASAIHEMVKQAKELEEIDLSNCRKVNDALLMHVIGNVPLAPPQNHPQAGHHGRHPPRPNPQANGVTTVLGSQKLKRLTLSYCKHVTDRSMAHIGHYARTRLEEVDLTRCTTITDHGFEAWGQHQFSRLTKLCLADCTYLTDNAIVFLTNAAPGLRFLDLVRPPPVPPSYSLQY